MSNIVSPQVSLFQPLKEMPMPSAQDGGVRGCLHFIVGEWTQRGIDQMVLLLSNDSETWQRCSGRVGPLDGCKLFSNDGSRAHACLGRSTRVHLKGFEERNRNKMEKGWSSASFLSSQKGVGEKFFFMAETLMINMMGNVIKYGTHQSKIQTDLDQANFEVQELNFEKAKEQYQQLIDGHNRSWWFNFVISIATVVLGVVMLFMGNIVAASMLFATLFLTNIHNSRGENVLQMMAKGIVSLFGSSSPVVTMIVEIVMLVVIVVVTVALTWGLGTPPVAALAPDVAGGAVDAAVVAANRCSDVCLRVFRTIGQWAQRFIKRISLKVGIRLFIISFTVQSFSSDWGEVIHNETGKRAMKIILMILTMTGSIIGSMGMCVPSMGVGQGLRSGLSRIVNDFIGMNSVNLFKIAQPITVLGFIVQSSMQLCMCVNQGVIGGVQYRVSKIQGGMVMMDVTSKLNHQGMNSHRETLRQYIRELVSIVKTCSAPAQLMEVYAHALSG